MASIALPTQWSMKPSLGVQMNRGHPLAPDVLMLPFNEGAGVKVLDASGRLNHGGLNGADWVASSKGLALDFDGTNQQPVIVSDSPSLDLSSTMTLAAWLYPRSAKSYGHVGMKHNAYGLRLFDYDSRGFQFSIYDGAWKNVYVGSMPTMGLWYHVVGRADGSQVQLFVNGVKYTGDAYTSIATNANDLYIGAYQVGSPETYAFDGLIGYWAIWSRALSDSEIYGLRDEPWCSMQPMPRRYWVGEAAPPSAIMVPIISREAVHSAVFGGQVIQA